jgi:hypothetical protein
LLVVLWALILGNASTVGSLPARHVDAFPVGPIRAKTAADLVPESPVCVARSEGGSVLHSEKRLRAFLKAPRANDPYDDAASDDPNDDDDATDNLSGCCETDGPITAWLQEVVRCPVRHEAESALPSVEIPASPFLSVHRLRC